MSRGTGQIALLLAALCALITAASAYIAGATTKSLLVRVMTSAILAGSTGLIIASWFQNKLLQQIDGNHSVTSGQTVDIEVSDPEPGETEWQPLQVVQISQEDARVFPARK